MADRSATHLARTTAAQLFSNAILGYKVKAFTLVFAGIIASTLSNGILSAYWR